MGQLIFRDEGAAVGLFGNVLVTLADGPATQRAMLESRMAHRAAAERYPRGYAHLIVTATSAPLPSADMRKQMQETTREFSRHMLAHAIVLEGDGLIASSLRAVTQAMLLAIPRTHPHRAFAEVESATLWVREQMGAHVSPMTLDSAALSRFVDRLRAEKPYVAA